jgi:uncharacterized membrane protein (UPF0127 family)
MKHGGRPHRGGASAFHGRERRSGRRKRWAVVAGLSLAGAAVLTLLLVRMTTEPPELPVDPPAQRAAPPDLATVTILGRDGDVRLRISAEIADDDRSREVGLMYRRSLARTHGMLFLFERSDTLSFWMRNTRIPLDMIFADTAGRIVTIHRNTVPYSEQSYPSAEPASTVLEVAAGVADEAGITTGDRITWVRPAQRVP